MNLITKKYINNSKGFSLMEIIIAMAIIVAGIVSMLALFNYNYKMQVRNKNKVIATYLAQEAIEVLRQKRDDNWFRSLGSAGAFLGDQPFVDSEKMIVFPGDVDDLTKAWNVEEYTDEAYKKVYIKNGNYVQANSAVAYLDSGFERYVILENNNDGSPADRCDIDNCLKITVIVNFRGEKYAEIEAFLYDKWI